MTCLPCHRCLTGTKWRINRSSTVFVVVNVVNQFAYVENLHGPARRRRILAHTLKPSNAKTGYTHHIAATEQETN